jgi:hypothetical protein
MNLLFVDGIAVAVGVFAATLSSERPAATHHDDREDHD